MDPKLKKLIEKNLNTLDYLEGTGVISTRKRKLADECYLFISSGGTGHRVLTTLRRQLEWQVDSLELEQKVRFLAIDADYEEMDALVKEQHFSRDEVVKLPFEGAHESIAPGRITPQMKEWVYPDLYDKTGGKAVTAPSLSGFDSSGAGAWRQPGRIRMCQPNTLALLNSTLQTVVNDLASNMPAEGRLHVFFLAGLAGGTGSGTIVDLTFLTRHMIKTFNRALYQKTQVAAYMLLPTACGTKDNDKGHQNAYAALKEIDYFMGLQARGESFCQQYGPGYNIDVSENIFDFCTLVEGVSDVGIPYPNPAETAKHVTANSILNLIAVPDGNPNKARPFLADAFLSNRTQNISTAITRQSHRAFPRNANYVYNVIGYSCCVVPIDLITVCVANMVFERVWAKFDRYKEATPEAADNFLQDCFLEPKHFHKQSSKIVYQRIEEQTNMHFREKGPYYMINLLNEARKRIVSADYAGYAARKAGGMWGKEDWSRTERNYYEIRDYFVRMNHDLFEVYTEVIDQLRDLLRKNAGLLTETEKYKNTFGNSFNWSPIDLTKGERASMVIKEYMDQLLPEKEIRQKAQRFVDLMCSMKDEWTMLRPSGGKQTASFDVARVIRDFVEKEFQECVNTTMEAFLVKLYSGNPGAQVPELDAKQDPEGHVPVEKAAEMIIRTLDTKASPLAQTSANFYLRNCSNNIYITVPDGCKWLTEAIANYAATNNITQKDNIYCSSSQNEIVLYQLFAGVPAWSLNWIERAEENYEQGPENCGLHIEKSRDGWGWDAFPNLSYEYDSSANGLRRRAREESVIGLAKKDLAEARDLRLLVEIPQAGTSVEQYDAYLLKDPKADPAEVLAQVEMDSNKCYSQKELYGLLEEKGIMRKVPLRYANTEFNTQERPVPADLGWELAYKSLRHMMAVWTALRDTLRTAETLKSALDVHNEEAIIEVRKREREMVFLSSLSSGLLTYNALRKRWYGCAEDEFPLGGILEQPYEWECKEYYAAQAFYALDEDIYQPFARAKQELENEGTDEQLQKLVDKRKELRTRFMALRRQTKPNEELDIRFPMASDQFRKAAGDELCQKIRDFYDWMINSM